MIGYKDHVMLFEKFDKNIKKELMDMGITDPEELKNQIRIAKKGYLAEYLREKGSKFTFGILDAIFKDALEAKKSTDLKIGAYKMVHRIVPIAMAPFFPILAIIGYILGTTRAINKIWKPLISDPGSDYSGFLKRMIDATMKISEGDIKIKDRFTRAFVISDDLASAIKPEVIHEFSIFLSKKMESMPKNMEVPEHFVENELKTYINDRFKVMPKIPLKIDWSDINESLSAKIEEGGFYDKIFFYDGKGLVGRIEYNYDGQKHSMYLDKDEKEFYLAYIHIEEDKRGNMYSKEILDWVKSYAKKLGATIITLRIDYGMGYGDNRNENDRLDRLYLKNGFQYTFTEEECAENDEKNLGGMHFDL